MPCSLLLLLAIGPFLPVSSFQQEPQVLTAPSTPWKHITIDAATGTVSRGPRVQDRTVNTVVEFDNLDATVSSIGSDLGGGACEWFMAGGKGRNSGSWTTSLQFVYCTSALDPNSGGAGAALRIGMYEGYHIGGGTPTTAVALLPLQGLPGRSPSVSSQCYFVVVEFDPPVSFADGPVGFSWSFTDLGVGGQAATVPFLACVQSCAGPGPDGQGMVDRIDRYCPPGTLVSSASITPFASSMVLAVNEIRAVWPFAIEYLGDHVNADYLSVSPITLGEIWTPSIGIGHPHGSGGPMLLRMRSSITNGPNLPSLVGGRTTEVLISGPLYLVDTGLHNGTIGGFRSIHVPVDLSLAGLPWAAQATVAGGGYVDLSTVTRGRVGTF